MLSPEEEFAEVRDALDARDVSSLIFYRNELEMVEMAVVMLETGMDWLTIYSMHPTTRRNILRIHLVKDATLRKERIGHLKAYRALLDDYVTTRVN